MDSRHQRNICQIIHKFFTNLKKYIKSSQNFEMPCHAAATDVNTGEGIASGLGWYYEYGTATSVVAAAAAASA